MGKRNKRDKRKGKRGKGKEPVAKKEPAPVEKFDENDPKQLLKKYDIQIGPDGYVAAPPTTPKNIDIDNFKMMDPGGGRILLHPTDLKIVEGMKYGLIGKNGYGKTTLLRLMSGYQIEGFPAHIRMLLVKQEQERDDRSVIDAVLNADEFRVRLERETERMENYQAECPDEEADIVNKVMDVLYNMAEDVNYDQGEKEAHRILDGLGFTAAQKAVPVSSLSGGWRMRVALAKALFVKPDLLLLDEPTNHLDFPTVLWLQQYLKNYEKTVVVVSHDRTFLNQCITHVIHLHDQQLTYYKGTYNQFVKERERKIAERNSQHEKLMVQIRHLREFIEKYKDCGPKQEKRAAQVKEKRAILAKLELECPEEVKEEKVLRFEFPDIGQLEDKICRMNDISFSWDPDNLPPLLKNISMHLDEGDRIGMIGANGVGKTTLVKLIMNTIQPQGGEVQRNRQARIALFTQHHVDQLDTELSAVEFILKEFADDPDLKENKDRVQTVRRRLGRFHITGQQQTQKMKFLSGGQKSRVAFAVATWRKPHFLIMDEPTNHLDIETIESLIHAVRTFKGGVLLISHDQHFLRCACDQFWAVTADGINIFESFELAKRFALRKLLPSTVRPKAKKKPAKKPESPKPAKVEEEVEAAPEERKVDEDKRTRQHSGENSGDRRRREKGGDDENEDEEREKRRRRRRRQEEEQDDDEEEDEDEERERRRRRRRRKQREEEEENDDDEDEEREKRRRRRRRKQREEEGEDEEEDDEDRERRRRRRRKKREEEDDEDEDEDRERRRRRRRKKREEEEEEDEDEDDERRRRHRRRRKKREEEEEEDDDDEEDERRRRRRRKKREEAEGSDDDEEQEERRRRRRRKKREEEEEEDDDDEEDERRRRRRRKKREEAEGSDDDEEQEERRRRRRRKKREEEEEEDDDDEEDERRRRRRRRKKREEAEGSDDEDDDKRRRRRRRRRRENDSDDVDADDDETAI